ncbi:Hypothetical protein NTJ_12051 [Nesidiocoris tenuis]|uniref:Cadherin domain-containing protein n=1 Tax=Nesidiocoris tenuis TaxID=355587 RepID=A0ABN7B4B9_9HEMI|nr:Hypothetical protein NTJ_12051 [Nesidiocoris tenuis]
MCGVLTDSTGREVSTKRRFRLTVRGERSGNPVGDVSTVRVERLITSKTAPGRKARIDSTGREVVHLRFSGSQVLLKADDKRGGIGQLQLKSLHDCAS